MAITSNSVQGASPQALQFSELHARLASSEIHLNTVLDHSHDGVLSLDEDGSIAIFNTSAERIFCVSANEVQGQCISNLIPSLVNVSTGKLDLHASASLKTVDGQRGAGDSCPLELRVGEMSIGGTRQFLLMFRDVSERERAEEQIRTLAQFDTLTGLPNRTLFQDRLETAVAQAKRQHELLGIMFIDLDRFKSINDTLGHGIGDKLLQSLAGRIKSCTRAMDTVARLGGDEFAIIQTGLKGVDGAVVLARKILQAIDKPLVIDGNALPVTGSIGISVYPVDDRDPIELLKDADLAMYQAKDESRNSYRFFCADMQSSTQHRMLLEKDLRHALEANEFLLHYQPQISISERRVVGMEALVRWQHPERGLVPPNEFIPAAEESGLIVPLGEWVLQEACRQRKAWNNAGVANFKVAVNLSTIQFKTGNLVNEVEQILAETDLPSSSLELEITESLLMQNADAAVEVLSALHQRGVTLAIDDFGTGYSSLGYLDRFPVDKIKIDRSFVNAIDGDGGRALIVDAVLGLAKNMLHVTVAEGVETEAQLAYLERGGCDVVQGYLFSRPLPAEQVPAFLEQYAGW